MRRFKKIMLVAAKGSDNAVVTARAIVRAARNWASLTVVDVLREPSVFSLFGSGPSRIVDLYLEALSGVSDTGDAGDSIEDLRASMVRNREQELERIVARARKIGVEASARVMFGVPFVEIIRQVIAGRHDLVMIAAEGGRGLRQILFGRTSMHLMRKCPCPVWVFKPSRHRPHDRILAAVDPIPCDDASAETNEKILDLAVSLAEIDQADLYVVHAWAWLRDLDERSSFALGPVETNALRDEFQRIGKECIDRLLARHRQKNVRIESHTLDGSPEEVIPAFARDRQIDLIVMGTVCKTGIDGFLMGRTAETVLRNVNCSVLTVKPDGFVSPVKAAA